LWDSHPLQLGATPVQVFIDGIPQFDDSHAVKKPAEFQNPPKMPNFDHEATETLEYDGLPPLKPKDSVKNDVVIFTNVSSVYGRLDGGIAEMHSFDNEESSAGVVVVNNGRLICVGTNGACAGYDADPTTRMIDLQRGSIAPGLTSYGTNLGLQEISAESSTVDGPVIDALAKNLPGLLGEDALIRATDGLQFFTRDAL
jgi:hypothetical protein